MSSTKLVRWGGMAALVAGGLLLLGDLWGLLQVLLYGDDVLFSEEALTTSFAVESVGFLVAALLLPVAAAGLYARHAQAFGTFGLVGFLAALVGSGLMVGLLWALTFVAPSVAIEAPTFLDNEEVAGPLNAGFILSGIGCALGWALFGVAMLRARVLPRAATAVLAIGALFIAAPLPASSLLFDAALVWIGLIVFRTTEPSARRAGSGMEPQAH